MCTFVQMERRYRYTLPSKHEMGGKMDVNLKAIRNRALQILHRVWIRTDNARVLNRAAELAFWFLLGSFPMAVSVVSIASLFHPIGGSQGTLMQYIGKVLPASASGLVSKILGQTTGQGREWFTLLFALWSTSSATSGVMETLNAISDAREERSWWKAKLIAILLAIAIGVVLTAVLITVLFGPELLLHLLPNVAGTDVWKIAQWPAAGLLLVLALLGLYRVAPSAKQHWTQIIPGSVIAAMIWIIASLVFRLYVRHFSDFGV
ncbi:MAG: YihY/virulence factor BrkB family protein, partial [Nitrospirota bacterium]|nr:YihY/virulence factor BrkB family protein [Nitrospirota bacterium]